MKNFNDNSQWRVWTKVVACLDIVLCGISLLSIIGLVASMTTTVVVDNLNVSISLKEARAISWIVWLNITSLAINTIIELWTSFELYEATQMGQKAIDAYENSKNWRFFCIFYMLTGTTINIFLNYISMMALMMALIRGVCVFIVSMYIKELQANTSTIQDPTLPGANV